MSYTHLYVVWVLYASYTPIRSHAALGLRALLPPSQRLYHLTEIGLAVGQVNRWGR